MQRITRKEGAYLRKDQARRLRYQEKQRIEQKAANVKVNNKFVTSQQSAGQLESFSRKLVK